jgi:hypothetical protein
MQRTVSLTQRPDRLCKFTQPHILWVDREKETEREADTPT